MKSFLKRSSGNPLDSYGDPKQITTIFYWFISLIVIGLVFGAVILLSENTQGTAFGVTVIAIGFIPVLISTYFIRRQNFEMAAFFLAVIMMALITLLATNGLGIHHVSNLAFPMILIIASLVMRKRVMAFLTLFAVGCAAWLVFGELSGAYTPSTLVHSVAGDFYSVALIIVTTAIMVRLVAETLFQSNRRLKRELEERKLAEERIQRLAKTDSLTNLINRREFERRLETVLASAQERSLHHVLCYLDLDQFKIVNDTAGHAAGDEMLKQIANLLSGLFRQRDTLARLGGDEFGLLLENCELEQALVICSDILTKVHDFNFTWEGDSFHVGVSIGVVPITADKTDIHQLLSQADIACYSAKDLGRNRVVVYQDDDTETIQRHTDILQAARLRDAIVLEQFQLYCQPIISLNGKLPQSSTYEVLLRMLAEEQDIILPSVFIPAAERYGLMPTIDRWVIRQTFTAMSQYNLANTRIAINLSGNSLDDDSLLEYVLRQLQEFSIPPGQVSFEITETAAIHHLSKAQNFIREFRNLGGKISLDDFGSGFSSFRYLKALQVDYIKIDGSFIHNLIANPDDQAIVEAIIRVAHTMGIHIIAEHVGNQATIDRLKDLGVEAVQGFGIAHPAPVEDVWAKH